MHQPHECTALEVLITVIYIYIHGVLKVVHVDVHCMSFKHTHPYIYIYIYYV